MTILNIDAHERAVDDGGSIAVRSESWCEKRNGEARL